jgi:hypothetical protein
MGILDMVKRELTWENLIRLRRILKEEQKNLGDITNWLYKAFSVDLEQHDLFIMALINRTDLVCWELMQLQGTAHWRSYIRNA